MMANNNWVVWLTEQGEKFSLAWLLLSRTLGVVDFACWVNFSPMALMELGYGWTWIWCKKLRFQVTPFTDTWQVNPRSCLILWGYIAYIQRGEQLGKIGFTPISSK
jgi:hypothetical protein